MGSMGKSSQKCIRTRSSLAANCCAQFEVNKLPAFSYGYAKTLLPNFDPNHFTLQKWAIGQYQMPSTFTSTIYKNDAFSSHKVLSSTAEVEYTGIIHLSHKGLDITFVV
ncbi:hypothetical protein XELAEV_18038867mg [Xenopus laevis]|uniref:Uncharacterized protein n=1 Tax=Xenopus laevis TaxID=8355 RepID=A0A974C6T6_XENLA|nr:hypothetical protein XELAEV_18038867mg [Xenopus laevis]